MPCKRSFDTPTLGALATRVVCVLLICENRKHPFSPYPLHLLPADGAEGHVLQSSKVLHHCLFIDFPALRPAPQMVKAALIPDRKALHTATAFSSSSMVLISAPHHSDRFARTRAVAKGGGTAFPHLATCLAFPYSFPV